MDEQNQFPHQSMTLDRPSDRSAAVTSVPLVATSAPPTEPSAVRRWPYQHPLLLVGLLTLWLAALGGGALLLREGVTLPGQPARTSISLGAPSAPAPLDANAAALQDAVVDVIRAVQPSVVEVQSSGAQGQGGIGSGNIVTGDGYIVTNDHVVRGFDTYVVHLADGKTYPARLVGEAPQDDLAVLKIDATGLRPIAFGTTSDVTVGQFVLALGSPLGLRQSATFGIVSALDRTASEAPGGPAAMLTGLIQTSAPINPGNSGGALVNLRGELVGVPTLGVVGTEGQAASGIGFAIPVDRLRFVADQLIRDGHVSNSGQGFLGVQGVDITPQIASASALPVDHGVLVRDFANAASGDSPARAAGVRAEDVIVAVDGKPITGNGDLAAALLARAPGSSVTLTVMRGGEQVQLAVTLGERPVVPLRG